MNDDERELLARYAAVPGQSVGITREPPQQPLPEWRWGGPKPDGYKWPSGSLTPGLVLICQTCFAAVIPTEHERHADWHASVNLR